MSEEEIIQFYNELKEHFGDNLANFEHHPRQFAYQIKLYKYYKARKQNEDCSM